MAADNQSGVNTALSPHLHHTPLFCALPVDFQLLPLDSSPSLPSGSNDKEPTCQCRRGKRHEFDPWVGKIPWRRKWPPAPVFWPWESYGQRSLVGYSPSGHKSWTQLRLKHHHWDGALLPGGTLLFLVYSRDSIKKDLQVLPGNETWVYHSGGIPKIGSLRALITWLQGGERLSSLSVTGREGNSQALNMQPQMLTPTHFWPISNTGWWQWVYW